MTDSYRLVLAMALVPLLCGCIVKTAAETAVDVVTIPVKVASAGVNAALPNQKKADEKRGAELRKQDEERGKEFRAMADRCQAGRALPTDNCMAVQASPAR
ncbi:MAG TPA: hypothetical protein VFT61_04050 [Sphingomicrobium sp.]|nr:hypothetical protein [Sphingomicrobium sp.]